MCRVAGRRCEHNWTETQRQADLARRRAIYAEKRRRKTQQAETVPQPLKTTTISPELATILDSKTYGLDEQALPTKEQNPKFYQAYTNDLTELRPCITALAEESSSSPLAQLKVAEEDHIFSDENDTLSNVRRLTLEDGTVGYWKGYQSNMSSIYWDGFQSYRQTPLSSMVNEVAAYQLAKRLGLEDLIPETVIREVDGEMGSFQKEAKGTLYAAELATIPGALFWDIEKVITPEHQRELGIFDYLLGSQDRHSKNFLITKKNDGENRTVLIDNSFCFPGRNGGATAGNMFLNTTFEHPENRKLTATEQQQLIELTSHPTMYGMDRFLPEHKLEAVHYRARTLLSGEAKMVTIWPGEEAMKEKSGKQ